MNKDHYISLIYKQLKGIITSEEQTSLQAWESESSENHSTVEEIRNVWEVSEEYELPFELDHKTDFAKVKSNLNPNATTSKVVPIQSRRRWLNIAAAAVLLFGVGFLLQNYFEKSDSMIWKQVAASSKIQEITLPDGSKVWLSSESTLAYPEAFEGNNRPIKLTGEAFFEVTKDANKPFQIFTEKITTTVLGTAFNVDANPTEKTIEVTVQEGKVKVKKNETDENVILIPKEKAIFDKKNNTLKKSSDQFLNDLAWKRKSLRFQNTDLETVLTSLGEAYNFEIRIMNPAMKNCTISGRYNIKTDLKKLLNNIATNSEMTIHQVDHHVFELHGGVCKK